MGGDIVTQRARKPLMDAGGLVESAEVGLDDRVVAAASPPPAGPPPEPWLRERFPDLLDGLPPASRAVLLLHYGEDLSLGEVGAVLALPEGTVRSRLHYGLKLLRERIESKLPAGADRG